MRITNCNPDKRLSSADKGNNLGVFFEVIKLPVSMGSSATGQPNAPYVGLYANKLVQYQADGSTYIFDSNGNFTSIANAVLSVNGKTGNVEIAMSDLINDANFQDADQVAEAINKALDDYYTKSEVDAKDSAIANTVVSVRAALTAETAARTAADEELAQDLSDESTAREEADTALQTALDNEVTARTTADSGLQSQIDAITVSSDVIDVLGTHAELEAYDTAHVNPNDIIKVLQDETRDGATTYYRWTETDGTYSWVYVGAEGPYYTKGEADTLLDAKLGTGTTFWGQTVQNDEVAGDITLGGAGSVKSTTEGSGLYLSDNAVGLGVQTGNINTSQVYLNSNYLMVRRPLYMGSSSVDTNQVKYVSEPTEDSDAATKAYVDNFVPATFTGTDGTAAGTAGLVPAPTAADAGKVLGASGNWVEGGTGQGGETISEEDWNALWAGGQLYAVDAVMSTTSTNVLQNKVITLAFDGLSSRIDSLETQMGDVETILQTINTGTGV